MSRLADSPNPNLKLMRPLALKFYDGPSEQEFARRRILHALGLMRLALGLGGSLYLVFALLDSWIIPAVAAELFALRLFVSFVMLVSLGLTWVDRFRLQLPTLMVFNYLLASSGLLYMMILAGLEGTGQYFSGLILALIWLFSLSRAWLVQAAFWGLWVIAGYELVALWLHPLPFELWVNNNFFLWSGYLLCLIGGYEMEYWERRSFLEERTRLRQSLDLEAKDLQIGEAVELQRRLQEKVESQSAAFLRHLAVEIMNQSLSIWREATLKGKVEFAETSGIWHASEDNGTWRTRTLDKYFSLAKLPGNPRWDKVIDTALYVLRQLPEAEAGRQAELKEKLSQFEALLYGLSPEGKENG